MKEATTYLMFDGNCREAMEFYAKCLHSELQMSKYSEGPGGGNKAAPDRIMHARLGKGQKTLLMASDVPPGSPFTQGENFSIALECESREEIENLFAAVGQNGQATMPLQDTFWGAYFGMLKDQFGVHWMFNYTKPQ